MLELGEYRESVDIGLLCADRVGYRAIRSEVTQNSFGQLFKGEYKLKILRHSHTWSLTILKHR